MTYLDELSAALGAVGIRGRLRRRILLEAADHLAAAPEAPFGDPAQIAAQFAEVVGAARSRRAVGWSFAALVAAAAVYATAFVSLGRNAPPPDILGGAAPPLGLLAALALVVLPQVAFVGGVGALVARAPRYRIRRAAVGLAAGAGSLVGAIVFATAFDLHAPWLWATVPAFAATALAAGATAAAARIRTSAAARAELALTWRQGLAVAALVAAACGVAGASGGDPLEGVRNAVGEGVACASGFALLGRYLALRA